MKYIGVVFLALSECLVGKSQCLQRKRGARLDGAVGGEERRHKTCHIHSQSQIVSLEADEVSRWISVVSDVRLVHEYRSVNGSEQN